MKASRIQQLLCLLSVTLVVACNRSSDDGGGTSGGSEPAPTFSLAWSEYPSWSVFGVADELGLIDGDAGAMGSIEKEYGVDIELKEAGYDTCLLMFGSGECDAVCMTNMDALIVSPSRDGVAVLPTSTSNGADACLVTEDIADIEALKQQPVYGLEKSVSEYCFARCLAKAGYSESDFTFSHMDPAAAAQRMQQRSDEHKAIMVWNPFVLQTLRDRSDVRVLFDSSQIPGEIVDMVVVGSDVMSKPKADQFVKAVAAAFYGVGEAMKDPEKGDDVLVALGKKFSNLGLEDMKIVVQQTEFYKTPAEAKALLSSDEFKQTMDIVSKFCVDHQLVENPSISFGADGGEAKLRFDASLLED